MFRKLVLCSLAIFLTACTAETMPAPTPAASDLAAEEQAVYAAALLELYGAPMYVIMDTTATDVSGVDNTASTLDYVTSSLTGLSQETADSFSVRNETETTFRSNLDLGAEYVTLSRDAMTQIFSVNQSGWDVFYARYPYAYGITTLSRVGFNASLDQALVYVGTQSHWLAGAGYYLLLEKVDGVWTVQQQVMTWIS